MKIGCCGGADEVELYAELGFDYIEPPVQQVFDDDGFSLLQKNTSRFNLQAEAFNCLLPGSLPVVGPDVQIEAVGDYLRKAFLRIESLGGEIVVFGSGRARCIPPGFPAETAQRQLFTFLNLAAEAAGDRIKVVIEPLCGKQTNLLNLVSQARELCDKLNWRVGLLADLYHLTQETEPWTDLLPAFELNHIHVPFPEKDYQTADFIRVLTANGYRKRVSLEDNGKLLNRTPETEKRSVLEAGLALLRKVES